MFGWWRRWWADVNEALALVQDQRRADDFHADLGVLRGQAMNGRDLSAERKTRQLAMAA